MFPSRSAQVPLATHTAPPWIKWTPSLGSHASTHRMPLTFNSIRLRMDFRGQETLSSGFQPLWGRRARQAGNVGADKALQSPGIHAMPHQTAGVSKTPQTSRVFNGKRRHLPVTSSLSSFPPHFPLGHPGNVAEDGSRQHPARGCLQSPQNHRPLLPGLREPFWGGGGGGLLPTQLCVQVS